MINSISGGISCLTLLLAFSVDHLRAQTVTVPATAKSGLIGDQTKRAEELMTEYSLAREDVPRNLVIYGYKYILSVPPRKNGQASDEPLEMEFQLLEAMQQHKSGVRKLVISEARDLGLKTNDPTIWRQMLTDENGRLTRLGSAVRRRVDSWGEAENEDLDEDQLYQKYAFFKQDLDYFFLPLVHVNPLIKRKAGPDYAFKLLMNTNLSEASLNDEGHVQATWKFPKNTNRVTVVFGDPVADRPSRVIWKVDDLVTKETLVASDIATKWDKVTVRGINGKRSKIAVPVQVERRDVYGNGAPREMQLFLRWHQLHDDFEFPVHRDTDWRAPFREIVGTQLGWPMPTPEFFQ